MKAAAFLVRWLALKQLESNIRAMQRQTAKTLAEMDRTLAEMRDMKCPKCGHQKLCSDE